MFSLSIFMKTFGYKSNRSKEHVSLHLAQKRSNVQSMSFLSHQYQTTPKLWHQVLQVLRVIWFPLKICNSNKYLLTQLLLSALNTNKENRWYLVCLQEGGEHVELGEQGTQPKSPSKANEVNSVLVVKVNGQS